MSAAAIFALVNMRGSSALCLLARKAHVWSCRSVEMARICFTTKFLIVGYDLAGLKAIGHILIEDFSQSCHMTHIRMCAKLKPVLN